MKKEDVIRAWRDAEFYADLSDEQKAALPENPAAVLRVDDEALSSMTGGCSFPAGACPTTAICTPCPPQWCL